MKKASVILIVLLVLSCGQQAEKKAMSEYEAGVYQETLDKVKSLEGQLAGISNASLEEVDAYLKDGEGVRYRNDTTGMGASAK